MTPIPALDDYRVISDAYAVLTYRRVFLLSTRRKVTVADLRTLAAVSDEHYARERAKTCSLTISDVTTPMPDQEARQYAARLMSSSRGKSVGNALILEGEGFLAGTARAVGAAIGMLARQSVPWKTFSNASDASRWVATLLGYDAAAAQELAGLAVALRKRHLEG
jgi:hypothetical protein